VTRSRLHDFPLTAAFCVALPLVGLGAATFFPEGIDGVALAAHKNPATSRRGHLHRLILLADAHLDVFLDALLSLCEPQVFLEVLGALVNGADLGKTTGAVAAAKVPFFKASRRASLPVVLLAATIVVFVSLQHNDIH